ncbi:hypothetical protein INT48_002560 [Thamnidium elegans]|uniref:Kinetochore protein Spc24 n=1 Tax=Thamnidium elegans TaxID=101142 RepID=A0A8H7W2Z2_9FUNG|nr:hypothetical protein INT48_002560 [Thamnidium elegans]
MTETLETTLSKLDNLCQELETTDFFSPKKKSKEAVESYYAKAKHSLDVEQFIIGELELDYNKGLEKERELLKEVKESENDMSTRQQQMEEYQNKVTEESLRRDKLLAELKYLEQQIENESNDEAIEQNLNSETLKLAIFRKMGIQMVVEDDYQVKKAILSKHIFTSKMDTH